MNREKEIFEQALDLGSPQERVAFLKGACGDDAALMERLLDLLRTSEGADAFLPASASVEQPAKTSLNNSTNTQ